MSRRASRSRLLRYAWARSVLLVLIATAVIAGHGMAQAAAAVVGQPPAPGPVAIELASAAAGAFAIQTYDCPPGMDLQTLDPDVCTPSAEPLIEWRLTSDQLPEPLTQDDAEISGSTVTWNGLPAGDYFIDLTAEVYFFGHDDYFIPSSDQVTRQDTHTTRIYYRADAPHASMNAYVFSAGGVANGPGVVASLHNCPPQTVLADIQVQPCDEPITSGQLRVVCDDQGAIVPLERVTRRDDVTLASALPPGPCRLSARDLPDDHDLVYVFGGDSAGTFQEDEAYQFDLEQAAATADGNLHLTLYFVDASTPDDQDGDGLRNAAEEQLGTNPADADSDGDGASDLGEVRFGSDPQDPASMPR